MKNLSKSTEDSLDRLITSTRSPRGRFSAGNSWKLLEKRLHQQHQQRRFWLRAVSSAAVVLLCVASWAAYHALHPEPTQKPATALTIQPTSAPAAQPMMLSFHQQPLHKIAGRLSQIYQTPIRIEGDSLRNYRMTGTFSTDEKLPKLLELLQKAAGNFAYTTKNDTIIITSSTKQP